MNANRVSLDTKVQDRNRARLLDHLGRLGMATINVLYEGGGDSGDVTEIQCTPPELNARLKETRLPQHYLRGSFNKNNQPIRVAEEREVALSEALCDFAMDWLGMHHRFWEDGDGGRGNVTIDVASGRCALTHYEFYTESRRHDYEL